MGSKSPDGHQQGPNGHGSPDFKPAKIVNASSSGSSSADVDRGIVDEDDGDADDSDEEAGLKQPQAASEKKNKKRKKPKKKKAKVPAGATVQTTPPTVPVTSLFPSGYNKGQLIPYDNTCRITDEEKRYTSRLFSEKFLNDYRLAAEVHRQVRQYAQKEIIKPGASMSAIANAIEEGVYALLGNPCTQTGDRLRSGPGFPTGLCLNNVAAHWTPNAGGKEILLQKGDVLSVDFGVHVNGHIVDSAFTICFDETYDPLLAAVRAATNTGIALAGVDARMRDIGAAVQEVMESYEVVLGGGKVLPVKAVKSLTGHSILPYRIHGDKQVPFVKNGSRQIMEEGDVFAIETFGSTGRGVMMDDVGVYGYSRNEGVMGQYLQSASAKALLKIIDANFATIPFSRAHLERLGVKKYHLGMRQLVDAGIVEEYAPLVDQKGSMVAQFEHTVLLHSGGKEVLSRGEDY